MAQSHITMENAMKCLKHLHPKTKEAGAARRVHKDKQVEQVQQYLKTLGIFDQVMKLKFIHVAGTKGKGSTCGFIESILRQNGLKTGLFTSPHMISVTERIRLNGMPIEESKFLSYFEQVWSKLIKSSYSVENDESDKTEEGHIARIASCPSFFAFMTVMALLSFVQERVDVVILEVGIGGRRDCTNCIVSPVCVCVTRLDLDHCNVLGDTLDQIAYHKCGIFKRGARAFVAEYNMNIDEKVRNVVIAEAETAQLNGLCVVKAMKEDVMIQVKDRGQHQYENVSIAIATCDYFLNQFYANNTDTVELKIDSESIQQSLETISISSKKQLASNVQTGSTTTLAKNKVPLMYCTIVSSSTNGNSSSSSSSSINSKDDCKIVLNETTKKGILSTLANLHCRCETIQLNDDTRMYIDGAHTRDSIAALASFFTDSITKHETGKISHKIIILFNCSFDRNPFMLMRPIYDSCLKLLQKNKEKSLNVEIMEWMTSPFESHKNHYAVDPSFKQLIQLFEENTKSKSISNIRVDSLEDQDASWQHTILKSWKYVCEDEQMKQVNTTIQRSVKDSFSRIQQITESERENNKSNQQQLMFHVLVTGSLYLAGNVFKHIKQTQIIEKHQKESTNLSSSPQVCDLFF